MFKKDIYKMELATYEEYKDLYNRLNKIIDINADNILNTDFVMEE